MSERCIDKYNKFIANNKGPMFSFEYFPPKTETGVNNLYNRFARMKDLNPQWIDVTWGAGGSTSTLTHEICKVAQNDIGLETMMHLTCTNISREEVAKALDIAKKNGIRNILALRGDPPRGQEWKQIEGGFGHAVDLVKFIRQTHGDYFGITVAGYPEGHTECTSYEDDLKYLKEKMDAGADMIITQLFYDVDLFLKFVKDCRKIGISAPILPGMMPIHGFAGFERMTTLCKTHVPDRVRKDLEPIKHDDEAVKKYGVKLCIEMCQTLLENGIRGLHFYTLNLEKSVTKILEGLGLVTLRPHLPWANGGSSTGNGVRESEGVRPIFWSKRPLSYIKRTESWDEFPNGRWGDSTSPAFGDLTDYHLSALHVSHSQAELHHKELGEPKSEQDVFDTFAKFCAGEISSLPWSEDALMKESGSIQQQLVKLNKNGFLTINSQPAVNGTPSSDETVGWGPANGYVYQKAYLEFFCSQDKFEKLKKSCEKFPTVIFHAVTADGKLNATNAPSERPTAVTWGVFPCKEILQPTVVDPVSFVVWKDEAFALWRSAWANNYPEDSESRKVVNKMIDSYYLVNLVDNDYVRGDIFKVFETLLS